MRPPVSPPPSSERPPSPASSEFKTANGSEELEGNKEGRTLVPQKEVLEALPIIARVDRKERKTSTRDNKGELYLVEDDIPAFVKADLDVDRLNVIHKHLWMAGRRMSARSLVRLQMLGFRITVTDQADLHIVKWSSKHIFIKPLPKYILDYAFWQQYLCNNSELYENARGFLLSYIWLIRSPHDFEIAKENGLIRQDKEWLWWKQVVKDLTESIDINTLDQVNMRYQYGELRLGRINTVYRLWFMRENFVRGYLYEYNRYVIFFERNFAWLLGVFVYFSIILQAMQVGTGVPQLSGNVAFQRASHGFVAFSIVAVVSLLLFVAVVFTWIYFYNMAKAIGHSRKVMLAREKLSRERGRKSGGANAVGV